MADGDQSRGNEFAGYAYGAQSGHDPMEHWNTARDPDVVPISPEQRSTSAEGDPAPSVESQHILAHDDDTAGTNDHNRSVDYVEPTSIATRPPEPTRIEVTDGDPPTAAGTSFDQRFIDREPGMGTEPDGPTGVGEPSHLEHEDEPGEVTLERIKNDVLTEAKKERWSQVLHGFYDHEGKMYARVSKGDFRAGVDPSTVKVEYSVNLDSAETDEIRTALYEQFGAKPPADEEFEKQKAAYTPEDSPLWLYASVDTETAIPGVKIQERRHWRVLSENTAAAHGRDRLDFNEWGIMILGEATPDFSLEQAQEALTDIDGLIESNRNKPALVESLEAGRDYLEAVIRSMERTMSTESSDPLPRKNPSRTTRTELGEFEADFGGP